MTKVKKPVSEKKETRAALYGWDGGNTYSKYYDGKEIGYLPTTISYDILENEIKSENKNPFKLLHCVINEKEFYVGEYALKKTSISERMIGQTKVKEIGYDKDLKNIMLSVLGLASKEKKIKIALGVPYSQYKNGGKDKIVKSLKGKYKIEYKILNIIKEIEIVDVVVLIEGINSISHAIYNKSGELIIDTPNGNMIIGLDLGSYTINPIAMVKDEGNLVYSENLKLFESFSYGSDYAKQDAIDKIMAEHQNLLTRYAMDDIVINKSGILKSMITNDHIDIIPIFNQSLKEVAEKFAVTFIDKLIYTSIKSKVSGIVMYGGGALCLDYAKNIGEKIKSQTNIEYAIIKDKPNLLNVISYYDTLRRMK